jgi:hypothetical protein
MAQNQSFGCMTKNNKLSAAPTAMSLCVNINLSQLNLS